MPIEHKIREDLRLIISIHSGSIPDQVFLESYQELLFKEEIYLTYNHLLDLRNTDSSIRSTNALKIVVEKAQEMSKGKTYLKNKFAIVAKTDLSFGLSRMFQGLSSPFPKEVLVFRDIKKALAWLELPENVLDDLF